MKCIADSFLMPEELGNIFLAHRRLFKFFSGRRTNYSQREWKESKILAFNLRVGGCKRRRKGFKSLLRQRPCLLKTISRHCTGGAQRALKTLSFLKGSNLQFTGNRSLSGWRGWHTAILLALNSPLFLCFWLTLSPLLMKANKLPVNRKHSILGSAGLSWIHLLIRLLLYEFCGDAMSFLSTSRSRVSTEREQPRGNDYSLQHMCLKNQRKQARLLTSSLARPASMDLIGFN